MHATLIHSVGQRKRLSRRWRARHRNSGGFFFSLHQRQKKSLMGKKKFFDQALSRERSRCEAGRKVGTLQNPPAHPLVLRHLIVGGVWQETKKRGIATLPSAGGPRWWLLLEPAGLCMKRGADLRRIAAGRQRHLQRHAVSSWRTLSTLCPSLTRVSLIRFSSFSSCHCSCFSPPGL